MAGFPESSPARWAPESASPIAGDAVSQAVVEDSVAKPRDEAGADQFALLASSSLRDSGATPGPGFSFLSC